MSASDSNKEVIEHPGFEDLRKDSLWKPVLKGKNFKDPPSLSPYQTRFPKAEVVNSTAESQKRIDQCTTKLGIAIAEDADERRRQEAEAHKKEGEQKLTEARKNQPPREPPKAAVRDAEGRPYEKPGFM